MPSCHSTNSIALDSIEREKTFEGTIFITDHQTAGEGQRGNRWESEKGQNLTFSVLLKPFDLPANDQFMLNIIISLGILDFLNQYMKNVKVKWPNDLYVGPMKICGILIQNLVREKKIEQAVIGIGLNVNQIRFTAPHATSIAIITGEKFETNVLLEELMLSIEKRYLQWIEGRSQELKSDYLGNLYWYGEERTFKAKNYFKGRIVGINDEGRLVIESEGEYFRFDFKEVEFIAEPLT